MADETSPCGLVRIEWQSSTGLMSHEINSPRFVDARSGQPFLTLWDEQWDANIRWDGAGRFRFWLRNYGRPGNLEADVDLVGQTLRLIVPAGAPVGLDAADRTVRTAFDQLERERRIPAPPPPARRPKGVVVGFVAVMAILLGIVIYRFG